MELLFVTVIAAGIGATIRSVLPNRTSYGLLLLPGVAASATALTWVGLVYLGWKFDGTWIWVVSLGVAIVVSFVLGLMLPRSRKRTDAELLERLSKA